MNDHSCITVVPAADKDNVSKVLAAFWGDDPLGTNEFSVQLSSDGTSPATHWAFHIWQDNANAAILTALPTNSGTLPAGINLTPYGVTGADAKASCANISRVSVKTGAIVPATHLQDVMTDLALMQVAS